MWQTQRDLTRSLISATLLAASLVACLSVVLFSWPEREQRGVVARNEIPVLAGFTSSGADLRPAGFGTGTIRVSDRSNDIY